MEFAILSAAEIIISDVNFPDEVAASISRLIILPSIFRFQGEVLLPGMGR